MKKLTRQSLDEMARTMPIIVKESRMRFVGGGNGTSADPYTMTEFDSICSIGSWGGGYVEGLGYVNGDAVITGSVVSTTTFNDYQSSYIFAEGIGLTSSYVVNGGVRIENGIITVCANGLSHIQGVAYSGRIELIVNGSIVESQSLGIPSNGVITNSGYSPIGSASFDKSKYGYANIQVRLIVSYSCYNDGHQSSQEYREIVYSSNN